MRAPKINRREFHDVVPKARRGPQKTRLTERRILLAAPKSLHDAVARIAFARGVSVSEWWRRAALDAIRGLDAALAETLRAELDRELSRLPYLSRTPGQ